MSKTLLILNDPPYGSERCYNALRLAGILCRAEMEEEVRLFLLGDAASYAKAGQKVPQGYYSTELMLDRVARAEALVRTTRRGAAPSRAAGPSIAA